MKRLSRCTMVSTISLLIILPKKCAKACGFYIWPGEYRFWLLQPDLTNQRDLSPFFFATTYFYPGNAPEAIAPFHYDQNVQEWLQLTGDKATAADINTILYHTKPDAFLNGFNKLAGYNSFARLLKLPQNKQFRQYMELAKKIEVITTNPDPWQENVTPHPAIGQLIDEASAMYTEVASPVIRLRIAYQLIRLYAYDGEYALLKKTYQEKIAPVKSNSWIKSAALYELAIKSGFRGDYLLSQVFDQSTFNRSHCLNRLRSVSLKEVLPFTANQHERIVLYAMKSFSNPGRNLHNLRFIYDKEPAYKELSFLILREINKVEDWLLTTRVTGFGPATDSRFTANPDIATNYRSDTAYSKELYDFIKRMIADHKNKDRALLHICAAHVAFIRGDYKASHHYLDVARQLPNLPANVKTQLLVNDFLLRLEIDHSFNTTTENRLMQLLLMPNRQMGVHSAGILKDQLILYTGRKLIRYGMRAKGFLLLGKTHRALGELPIGTYKRVYEEIWEKATPPDYDSMLYILNKTQKTPFDKFVGDGHLRSPWTYSEWSSDMDSVGWDQNKLLDLKAGWYIRQDSLEKALVILKQLPAACWKTYPYDPYLTGNPFYVNMYHPHQVEKQERNYTKPQIIERIIQLKKKVAQDKKNTGLYYHLLGNAYYNMTYYGKHWLMSKPWWSITDDNESYQTSANQNFDNNYLGCVRARYYYLKAMQLTENKKLASLSCLMAGKCQEHYRTFSEYLQKKERGKYNNPYTRTLVDRGMGTDYYKELIEECATYSSFIKQFNKQ